MFPWRPPSDEDTRSPQSAPTPMTPGDGAGRPGGEPPSESGESPRLTAVREFLTVGFLSVGEAIVASACLGMLDHLWPPHLGTLCMVAVPLVVALGMCPPWRSTSMYKLAENPGTDQFLLYVVVPVLTATVTTSLVFGFCLARTL